MALDIDGLDGGVDEIGLFDVGNIDIADDLDNNELGSVFGGFGCVLCIDVGG